MACSIAIDSISAVDPLSNPPTALHVEGTATDCSSVTVSVVCNVGGVPDTAVASTDSSGHWAVDIPIAINSLCTCGNAVNVNASCVTDVNCRAIGFFTILCPEGCPAIGEIAVTPSTACNADGTRTVTFSVTITDASGVVTIAALQWDAAVDGNNSDSLVVNAGQTSTANWTHDYEPGTWTAILHTTFPEGCPDVLVEFTVDECPPQCPEAGDVTVTIGDCNANGEREVTLTFANPLTAEIDFGVYPVDTDTVIDAGGVGHWYAPPGPYTATITVEGCPPLEIPIGPLSPCVPGVPTGACCLPNNQCVVVTEQQCVAAGGTWQGDGTTCATVDCGGQPGGGGGGNGGGTGSSPLCPFFGPLIAMLLGLAITAGLLIVNFNCMGLPIPGFVWGIVAGLGIAAGAAFGLWLFLCQIGTCPCPTTCDLLAIVWSSFFGGAVVAAYLFGCCPLMGGFLVALGGIALIAFLAWAQQCFDWCTMMAYLVSAVVSGVGTVIAILAAIPVVQACALGPVGVGAGLLAAVVAAGAAGCIVASSSGSGTTGTARSRRRSAAAGSGPRAHRNAQRVVDEPVRGLGDVVARITAAAGVKPCVPCKSRAERLNRAVPFGRRVGNSPATRS